jgi:hypothetical protein
MNIPINFEKIEGTKFNVDGNDYYIEADNMEKGDCWVYRDGHYSGFSPLCFDIDWEKETYKLIKCESGQGRHGNVLATGVPLTKFLMKDMDSFINIFLRDTIRTLITHKSI